MFNKRRSPSRTAAKLSPLQSLESDCLPCSNLRNPVRSTRSRSCHDRAVPELGLQSGRDQARAFTTSRRSSNRRRARRSPRCASPPMRRCAAFRCSSATARCWPASPPASCSRVEFLLIYRGLVWTTATRAVLFIYTGAVLCRDRLALVHSRRSFPSVAMVRAGAVVRRHCHRLRLADAGRRSASNARRPHDAGRRRWRGRRPRWSSRRARSTASAPKRPRCISSWSRRRCWRSVRWSWANAWTRCRRRSRLAAFAYQTVWVVSVTFVVWFALIVRYSANRLSAFTFLDPPVRRCRRLSRSERAADAGFCR